MDHADDEIQFVDDGVDSDPLMRVYDEWGVVWG
jgi:hypothetical protein